MLRALPEAFDRLTSTASSWKRWSTGVSGRAESHDYPAIIGRSLRRVRQLRSGQCAEADVSGVRRLARAAEIHLENLQSRWHAAHGAVP